MRAFISIDICAMMPIIIDFNFNYYTDDKHERVGPAGKKRPK